MAVKSSMPLSTPKAISATECAMMPVTTAATSSMTIQAMVRLSAKRARRMRSRFG